MDSSTVFGSLVPVEHADVLGRDAAGVHVRRLVPDPAYLRHLHSGRHLLTRRWGGVLDVAQHLILPTITLVLVDIGQFVLITRSSLVDVLTEDFITTAQAKGNPRRRIVWNHGMRNAHAPRGHRHGALRGARGRWRDTGGDRLLLAGDG